MGNRKWDEQDNSMLNQKAMLRIKNLPDKPKVLDLFCGNGGMYKNAYKERSIYYHGVDKTKVHDPAICTIMNNNNFIIQNKIDDYNVFDLDDYGSPWKQMYLILRKLKRTDVTFFVTDGLVLHQKMDGRTTKFVSGTEQIPVGFHIPGLNRFYAEIFITMLKDIESRYGWKTEKAVYFHNARRTVYYWCLKMRKADQN